MSVTTTTASTIERLDVDPKTLLVDLNIRLNLNLNKKFIASIRDLGVLVPIGAVRTASALFAQHRGSYAFGTVTGGLSGRSKPDENSCPLRSLVTSKATMQNKSNAS